MRSTGNSHGEYGDTYEEYWQPLCGILGTPMRSTGDTHRNTGGPTGNIEGSHGSTGDPQEKDWGPPGEYWGPPLRSTRDTHEEYRGPL